MRRMKAPLELQSIIEHDANYKQSKHKNEVELKKLRDIELKKHNDLIKKLPYTPNMKDNPNDELSTIRQL